MKGFFEEKKYLYWGITALVVVAVAVIGNQLLSRLYYVRTLIQAIGVALRPIIIGLIFAYVFNPLLKLYEKYIFGKLYSLIFKKNESLVFKFTRGTGILFTLATVTTVVWGLGVLIIPELYENIEGLVRELPTYFSDGIEYFNKLTENHSETILPILEYLEQSSEAIITWARDKILPNANTIITNLSAGVYGFFRILLDIIIGVIVAVYLLFSKEKYSSGARKLTYAIFKKEHAFNIIRIVRFADNRFGGFIVGKVLDSAIIGCLSFIVFSIFDIPYTALVSVVIGVTNIIPFFGPFIGAIPCGVLILFIDPIKALTFGVLILAIQQLDGNIIGPKILGDRTGLDSFAVIFAILFSGGLFGIPGMILGVPMFATVYGIVKGICDMLLKKKNLPVEVSAYGHGKVVTEIHENKEDEE